MDSVLPKVKAVKNCDWEPARTGSYGLSGREDEQIRKYEEGMKKNLIALCPRGKGYDSSRFYEVCFYGRVPVIIGDNRVLGDDVYDIDSFTFRIREQCSVDDMALQIQNIYDLPIEFLQERAKKARDYYEKVVRRYMNGPTEFFIEFLERYCDKNPSSSKTPVAEKSTEIAVQPVKEEEKPLVVEETLPPVYGFLSFRISYDGGFVVNKSVDIFDKCGTKIGRYPQYSILSETKKLITGDYVGRVCLDAPEYSQFIKQTIDGVQYSCDYPFSILNEENNVTFEINTDEKTS
jgi:hypothetical protein